MIDNLPFSIICQVDVATLTGRPQDAYEFFQKYHKDKFLSTERLILFSSHSWPSDLIEHLYQASSLIDISNCFVLLVGPKIDQQQVLQLCNSDQSFETLVTDQIVNTLPMMTKFKLSDCLCPVPWTHLEINNKGDIKACCISQKYLGKIDSDDLEKSFNGTDMINFRQQFLDNVRPLECKNCWSLEDKGLTSYRHLHLSLLKKDLLTKYMSNPKLVSLDIKPGNVCNFKCRICNSQASSQHAQEQFKYKNIPLTIYNWAESNSLAINKIQQLIGDIKNLDMYGGEPFLVKSLTSLIQHAVEKGVASQMRLHYNSNGSIYPTDLVSYWPHFKHVDIQFSIDNIGPRFELERGGVWQEVDQNITRLVKLNLPNVKIGIMPAISIMNIYYLDELFSWCDSLGLPVISNYVLYPTPFALSNLTNKARDLIVKKFSNSKWPEMQRILEFIKTQIPSDGSNDGSDFRKLTLEFDQMRGQKFCDTHPELASAMGMC